MSPRRSRPLLIAPLIPAWAVIGVFVSEWLRNTHFLVPFVVLWFVLGLGFAGYILRQVLEARRTRNEARSSVR